MISVSISGRKATKTDTELITSGSVGKKIHFDFDAEWNNISRLACFTGSSSRDQVLDANSECSIPWECLQNPGKPLIVGIYGTDGAGNIVIPTIYCNLGMIHKGATPCNQTAQDATPGAVDQMLSVYRAYQAGELDGATGPQGPAGNDYVLTETDRKDIVAKSKQPLRGAAAALVKELYIPDLKGHTVTGTTVWWGRQTGTRWYSSARIMFDNNSSLFMEVRTENLKTQAESEAALRWMAGQMHHITKTIGTDVLDVYMIFSLEGLTLTENTYNNFAVESTIDLTDITYAPNVAKQLTAYSKRIKAVAAVKDGRKFVCSEQFFRDDNVNVYHSGTLIAPSAYNQWKQGQIVFATDVSYAADDVLFELTAQQRANEDIENDLASHTGGFKKSEQYGSDKYDFVSDPAGGTGKCIKLGGSGYSAGGADRFRIQFYRDVELTEYTDEVKVYFPQALLTRLAAYSDEIKWFLIGGLWANYGPSAWASSGMYSGYALSIGVYKDSGSNSLKYGIFGHERIFDNTHAESYVNRTEYSLDTAVLGGEWVTIRKHFEVGVNGYYKIDIIDSAGTHSFDGHMPIGVKEPEKESERYGTAVAADLPYRVITSIDGCKIYTSQAIAEYVLASTELAIYFKDYKCSEQKNTNAFTLLPFAEANGITMAAASVYNDTELRGMIVGKQDALTAGTNITISGTTISAVDTVYDDTAIRDRLTDAESAITDNARRDAALWDINDEQTYRRTEQTENGLNVAPTGAKYLSVEEIYGNSTQDGTPSPSSPVEIVSVVNPRIKVHGNNLFSGYTIGKAINATTGAEQSNATSACSDFIEFSGQMYFTAANISLYNFVAFYDINKAFISRTGAGASVNRSITHETAKYIRINFAENANATGVITDLNNAEIMLSNGSSAVPYEPYTAPVTYTINGTFRSAGTAHDSIVVERDKLTKVTRAMTLDVGEMNWHYTSAGIGLMWCNDYNDLITPTRYSTIITNVICSAFSTVKQSVEDAVGIYLHGGALGFVIRGSGYTNVNDFKTAFTGQKIVVELATPTSSELTFDGTGLELISTDKHITVTDADGRDVPWLATYFSKTALVNDVKVNGTSVVTDGVAEIVCEPKMGNWEQIEQFTLTSATNWTKQATPSGTAYNFRKVMVHRKYPSGCDLTGVAGYGRIRFYNASGSYLTTESAKPTDNTKEYCNISRFDNDHGMATLDYTRTTAASNGAVPWNIKGAIGAGFGINFGNCTKIASPSDDKDPVGTVITIYAIKA